jgi:hypothetical protein
MRRVAVWTRSVCGVREVLGWGVWAYYTALFNCEFWVGFYGWDFFRRKSKVAFEEDGMVVI